MKYEFESFQVSVDGFSGTQSFYQAVPERTPAQNVKQQ